MKKYQELENKIRELQEEVDRLKKEENLPEKFDRKMAMMFLENPSFGAIDDAFIWDSTPQGHNYWEEIADEIEYNKKYKVPDEAIIQLQKWVIQSFKEKYESSL